MAKKTFEGEGNPADIQGVTFDLDPIVGQKVTVTSSRIVGKTLALGDAEVDVLRKVLDRDRTSKLVHGGLKSLLTLTDDEAATLLSFLARI